MTDTQNDQQQNLEVEELTLSEFNFRPSASKQSSRNASQKSDLTVVNTKKHGMRIVSAPEIIESIGSPDKVQIALSDKGIAIGADFIVDGNYFQLRKAANKFVIYSSQLVNEITEAFKLDFTGITSISFQGVSYFRIGKQSVAFISLTQSSPVANESDEPELQIDEDNSLPLDAE